MLVITDILTIFKSSVENNLNLLGYVNHFDVWVPYRLSEENLLSHISACSSLLQCNRKPFVLKTNCEIVMGHEKWICTKCGTEEIRGQLI